MGHSLYRGKEPKFQRKRRNKCIEIVKQQFLVHGHNVAAGRKSLENLLPFESGLSPSFDCSAIASHKERSSSEPPRARALPSGIGSSLRRKHPTARTALCGASEIFHIFIELFAKFHTRHSFDSIIYYCRNKRKKKIILSALEIAFRKTVPFLGKNHL